MDSDEEDDDFIRSEAQNRPDSIPRNYKWAKKDYNLRKRKRREKKDL